MKTDCKKIKESLPLYIDQMMTHIDAAEVKEHLAQCPDCRQEYKFLKSIIDTTAKLPQITPSDDFNDRLHKKLLEAKKANHSIKNLHFGRISAAIVSAAAVIALSVVSLNLLNNKDISVSHSTDPEKLPPLEIAAYSGNLATDETPLPAETEPTTAPREAKEQNDKKKTAPTAAPKAEKNTQATAREEAQKKKTPVQQTPTQQATPSVAKENTPSQIPASSGGAAARSATPSVNVPSKVKLTVNVTVNQANRPLAKQILSGYSYSNGAYSLSTSEYYSVMSQLDSLGAKTSMTREDKTSTYAQLTGQLQTAASSEAGSIQKKLNQIDAEVSKTYLILN